MRKWNDSSVTESEMAALDFSEPPPSSNDAPDVNVDELVSTDALGKRGKDGIYEVADYHTKMEEDDDEMDDLITRALSKTALSSTSGGADEAASSKSGTFTSLFSRLTGSKTLEKDDLGPVMDAMEKHLMSKNVAREVCEKVCEGVESRLVGKKLSALTSGSSPYSGPQPLLIALLSTVLRRQERSPRSLGGFHHSHPHPCHLDRPSALDQEAPLAVLLPRHLRLGHPRPLQARLHRRQRCRQVYHAVEGLLLAAAERPQGPHRRLRQF